MSHTTYVDECKLGGFTLAASSIPCGEVTRLRATVNGLRMPAQPRIHFVSESPQRRKHIITTLTEAGAIKTVVYDARGIVNIKDGRDTAMARMAADQAAIPASRIVIESDDSLIATDQAIIRDQLEKAGVTEIVGVDHMKAYEEQLLAVPDAVAWCFTHGGEWAKLAEPLIANVVTLGIAA